MICEQIQNSARALREEIIETLSYSRRGHIGSAFSLVEILVTLYDHIMKHDPTHPNWNARDRLILSKGHGCLALYAILARHKYFSPALLAEFCHPDGRLGGHPKRGDVPGIEASTGSLGHGLSIAVGMALSLKRKSSLSKCYVIVGDGELNEGSNWEALLSAAKHELNNLTIIVDSNKLQSYGGNEFVCNLEPLASKMQAFNMQVREADLTQNASALYNILIESNASKQPRVVICHTLKGQGCDVTENNLLWHHKNSITDEEIYSLRTGLK